MEGAFPFLTPNLNLPPLQSHRVLLPLKRTQRISTSSSSSSSKYIQPIPNLPLRNNNRSLSNQRIP